MKTMAAAPPRFKGRIAGVFYLLTFLTGAPLVVVSGRLVVWSDAAKTAANILAHPSLFWLAFVSSLIVLTCYVVVTGEGVLTLWLLVMGVNVQRWRPAR